MTDQDKQMEQVTQAASQLGKPHSNETVPHKISNHDMLVQASIWAGKDVGWLNLNDTQDQLNMKMDLHKVEKVVQGQVELISGARSNANAAISQAESAQKASNVNQAAISNMDSAVKATQQEVSDAVANVNDANKSITKINTDLKAVQADIAGQSAAVGAIQADLSAAKQQIKDAEGNITAVNQTAQSAYSIASDANSNAVEVKQTAQSAYAVANDAKSNITQVKITADSAMTLATNAKSDAAEAKVTANGISTTVTGLGSQVQSLSDATKTVSDNMKNKADKGTVDQVISKLTTSINQAKDALTSKADKLDIDKLNKTVTDTQTLLNQKAGELSSTITQVSNKAGQNTTLISNLTQTVDGMQSTVKNKADQSTVSQLSNQITQKVSTKDYESEIALLQKDINLRVSKDKLISQINLEAGGDGLISIQDGKGRLMLDADKVVFGHEAFIPSAAIVDISADKIKTGTLDAGAMRVVNLTADSIHGGTLDVGSMNVKNLSANDITTGTLTGIDIKAGDNDNNFELKGQNIHWNRKVHYEYSNGASYDSSNYAVIGQFIDKNFDYGSYAKGDALTIGDHNEIRMGLISTYQDVDGSSQLGMQHLLKIVITYDDTFNPYEDRHQAGSLHNKQQINIWTTTKEFLRVVKETGIEAHLDDTLGAKSTFNIQKDNCVGAYFGQGNGGNQINFNFGGDGCGFNVNGPFHVTGAKNSIVETRQGYLAINAYETAEYYFGDIGENNTGSSSQVVIGIDRIFNETVNTDIQYQVFVTSYSDAHVWVEKRYNNRFIVCSDKPNAEFGWELKAKRKGYEDHRLRRIDVDFKHKI